MTVEKLEELLGRVTQGEWMQGQEGNHRVYGPDCMGDDSGLIASVYKGHANCTLIALAPSLARRVLAAEKLVKVCEEILDRGYISSAIEEERHDHSALIAALTAYREASK